MAIGVFYILVMKPFLSKTFDTVTFGVFRRRTTPSSSLNDVLDNTLDTRSSSPSRYLEHPDRDWSVYCKSSSLEEIHHHEDDVVFRKNNVYLKYPSRKYRNGESFSDSSAASSNSGGGIPAESMGGHQSIPMTTMPGASNSHTQSVDQDSNILVPGYFNISTRGSDFGQTLILNWSPNALMSQSDHTSSSLSASLGPGAGLMGTGGSKGGYDKPSVSSLSIDLSQMESIRVFYKNDPFDPVTGGEVVIQTRDRRFKIFTFKHGGLNELIKKFCSWKYFNCRHQVDAHQYLFTVFRPRLSLAELHPEEGLVNGLLTDDLWSQLKDSSGKVHDKRMVLQVLLVLHEH